MDAALNALDFHLLNDWQRDLPLTDRPYAVIAGRLGCTEGQVLARLAELTRQGYVSRVGAVFRPHVLGYSTLAALAVPPQDLERVARLVSAYPEVNHNYEREHAFNLWFVVTAPDRVRVAEVLADIARRCGQAPLDLPMLADYHIDLGFDLAGANPETRPHLASAGRPPSAEALRQVLEPADYALAAALEGGLALQPRPYAILASKAGLDVEETLSRLRRLLELGVIRRLGVVVRHRELGFAANAMVVWDVPDTEVDAVGRTLGAQAAVSLCYRRPRRLPRWRYNLYTMLHGREPSAVLATLERLRRDCGLQHIDHAVLFSRRRFKQCGARYAGLARAA